MLVEMMEICLPSERPYQMARVELRRRIQWFQNLRDELTGEYMKHEDLLNLVVERSPQIYLRLRSRSVYYVKITEVIRQMRLAGWNWDLERNWVRVFRSKRAPATLQRPTKLDWPYDYYPLEMADEVRESHQHIDEMPEKKRLISYVYHQISPTTRKKYEERKKKARLGFDERTVQNQRL